MSKRTATLAAALVLVAGIGGYAGFLAAKASFDWHHLSSRDRPVWTEVVWPFPIDEWGGGWAFQCKAADCGIDVNLYLNLPSDGFSLVNPFECPSDRFELMVEVAGFRYYANANSPVLVEDSVTFKPEPTCDLPGLTIEAAQSSFLMLSSDSGIEADGRRGT
jgi:hypothetical protein